MRQMFKKEAWCLAAVLFACGGDDGNGGTDARQPLAATQACFFAGPCDAVTQYCIESQIGGTQVTGWCAPRPTECSEFDCSCDFGKAAVAFVERKRVDNCEGAFVSTTCMADGQREHAKVLCTKGSL